MQKDREAEKLGTSGALTFDAWELLIRTAVNPAAMSPPQAALTLSKVGLRLAMFACPGLCGEQPLLDAGFAYSHGSYWLTLLRQRQWTCSSSSVSGRHDLLSRRA